MQMRFAFAVLLLAGALGLGACEGYQSKMPPNSPSGGILL
jgi:hypothetical protein